MLIIVSFDGSAYRTTLFFTQRHVHFNFPTYFFLLFLILFSPSQTERADMLDAIRQLTRTLKLKELIIANFIPEETSAMLERRAVWVENEEGDGWVIPVSTLFLSFECAWFVCEVCSSDSVWVGLMGELIERPNRFTQLFALLSKKFTTLFLSLLLFSHRKWTCQATRYELPSPGPSPGINCAARRPTSPATGAYVPSLSSFSVGDTMLFLSVAIWFVGVSGFLCTMLRESDNFVLVPLS